MAMMAFVALAGPIARVLGMVPWQMGVVVTMGGLAWMLASRSWGSRSDRDGRRSVLLTGALGFLLSYGAMCILVVVALEARPSPWWVFAGLILTRGMAGAFYAAIPVAGQALVADHVPPERRTSALATLGAASAMGLVLGPALAALLALHGLALPLYVTALLPALALIWLYRLPSDRVSSHVSNPAALKLSDPRLRLPLLVAFSCMASISIAQITVGFFAIDRLGLAAEIAARVAGLALTAVGVALMSVQLVIRRLRWGPVRLIRLGLPIAALGFGSITFASVPAVLIGGFFVAACGMGLVFPAFAALAANRVGPGEQGAAAGCIGAAQGLGVVFGPLAGTLLYELGPGVPYAFASVLLVVLVLWATTGVRIRQ